jgi:uncharacterized beta-barrel protein YwiB (DUF1934 family)
VVFIKIRVKGYLKNITDNEILEIDEKAIRNKNKITFSSDNVKNIIKINDNDIMLVREGNDFINTFVFNKDKSSCNYYLKDNNYDVDIDINTISIDVNDNSIGIKYLIVDSNSEYEYKLEMSDI